MRETITNIAEVVPATISSGTSLTPAVNFGGLRLFGIVMPSVWTAANLTFQISPDGSTWYNLYDASGNEFTVTAAASRYIYLDPTVFPAMQYVKARSGASASAVAQAQDSVLQFVLRSV
jgi:hypothetical protein